VNAATTTTTTTTTTTENNDADGDGTAHQRQLPTACDRLHHMLHSIKKWAITKVHKDKLQHNTKRNSATH
jgi:hypothetical protein